MTMKNDRLGHVQTTNDGSGLAIHFKLSPNQGRGVKYHSFDDTGFRHIPSLLDVIRHGMTGHSK